MSLKEMNSVELNRLINLIHVPEIDLEFKKLLDKFEDKDITQHIIDFHQRKWELFIELYMNQVEGGAGSRAAGEFFWFELTCYGPDDWRLTDTYPLYDIAIVPQYEILPPQVIEKIIDTPVKPREIRSAFNLEAVFWRKVVNVKFCRLSEGFICGTVELCKRLKGHIDRKKTVSIGPRAFEMTFRKFHYLFLRQPALIHSFILDFLKIKIPGLKIMTGKEQELNLIEPTVNLPGIDVMMKENPKPMLEENTGREPVNLLDLIDTPKARLLGQILQLQVQKSAGYEYKKQVADYETRLEQIRRDLIAKALE